MAQNEPVQTNRHSIILTNIRATPSDSYPMDLPTVVVDVPHDQAEDVHAFNRVRTGGGAGSSERTGTYQTNQGKNIVWTMVALHAEDQLRQRVAWALYQIFVISDKAVNTPRSEAWHAYYDIFVRHAFGCYRDVLREVSYSPMMGDYLTYRGNKAMASDGSYPDENFAREIMQLFSIGLHKLNTDGAPPLCTDCTHALTFHTYILILYSYRTFTCMHCLRNTNMLCLHCRHTGSRCQRPDGGYLHQRRHTNVCESVDWP